MVVLTLTLPRLTAVMHLGYSSLSTENSLQHLVHPAVDSWLDHGTQVLLQGHSDPSTSHPAQPLLSDCSSVVISARLSF